MGEAAFGGGEQWLATKLQDQKEHASLGSFRKRRDDGREGGVQGLKGASARPATRIEGGCSLDYKFDSSRRAKRNSTTTMKRKGIQTIREKKKKRGLDSNLKVRRARAVQACRRNRCLPQPSARNGSIQKGKIPAGHRGKSGQDSGGFQKTNGTAHKPKESCRITTTHSSSKK